MKTITIEDKTWEKISRLKLDLKHRNLTELIEELLKSYKKEVKKK